MNASSSTLDHLVTRASRLYSLPAVAMKVLELTDNPRIDVPALKQCIENDPALTTKVLRVVNSSLFGLSREVSDLNQALALLGIKPLKLLVLGFSLPERLFDGVAAHILGHYWRHTLTKAVAAREISETLSGHSGDEAFIAGLLQDLGVLLLIQEVGVPYVRLLERVYTQGGDLADVEAGVMGFNHTTLTSRLLDKWNLPKVLVHAVEAKAESAAAAPWSSSAPSLARVLRLAELVAQLLADGRADVLGQLVTEGGFFHGLSREQMEALVGSLEEKVDQLADVLSLHLPEGRTYDQVLAQAHRQLAEVAAEAAEDLIGQSARRPRESEGPLLADEAQALCEALAQVLPPARPPTDAAPGDPPIPERVAAAAHRAEPADSSTRPAPASAGDQQARRAVAVEADPGLLGRLAASVNACRKSHCALTLLLAELDDVDALVFTCGVQGLDRIRAALESACRSVDHPYANSFPYRDMGFAVILPHCERQMAVRLANQLVDQFHRLIRHVAPAGGSPLSVSVGAATLPVATINFPPQELLKGAERCLFGSHASGGGVVKSIEIY